MRIEQKIKNSPYGSYYSTYALIDDEGVEVETFSNHADAYGRLCVLYTQRERTERATRPVKPLSEGAKKALLDFPVPTIDLDGWDL